jgi:hypothetical protein
MASRSYLISLPERLLRSALGVSAGVARELGELALPSAVRRTRLYQNLVDTTLRFVIERVGGVQGVYGEAGALEPDFLAKRTAGNVIEALGLVAFRVSPVWVLAAMADVCGMGRQLIPEIADALKAQGLLDPKTQFTSVDQLLDGLERTSGKLADTVNTPPLDVEALRKEWAAIRVEARSIPPDTLPSAESIRQLWSTLAEESERQNKTIFETSSMLAVSAAGRIPDGLRWLSASTRVATGHATRRMANALLDHYRHTLDDLRRVGYGTYAAQQLGPYLQAAANQFSPEQRTLTERWLERRQP